MKPEHKLDPNVTEDEPLEVLRRRRDIINTVSPSFCTAKWLQTTLLLQNGFNHSCHHPSPHKIPIEEVQQNPAALHNSKFKKEQRKMMLKGDRPPECNYCWKIEDLGKDHFSDRHHKTSDNWWAWYRFDEIANSNPEDDMFPSYLEVSFSNACNFACAYCSPEISSKWMEDIKANGHYPVEFGSHHLDHVVELGKMPYKNSDHNPYVEAFKKWFPTAIEHLRVFRVTGGEPTMSKDFWETMDLIKQGQYQHMELAINTNLGVPDALIDKLIDYINDLESCVKDIMIFTSAESTGKQAEYVRDGINYNLWMNNIRKVLDKTNVRVCVMTTINMLSLPTFNEFISDLVGLRREFSKPGYFQRTRFSINYLRFPPHLQVTLLDEEDRNKFASQIENHCIKFTKEYNDDPVAKITLKEFEEIKRFCDYLRQTQTSGIKYRKDFVNFIRAYDIRRSKNFIETFPEYSHLLELWKDYPHE